MHIVRVATVDDERLTDYRSLTDVQLRRKVEPQRGLYMAESQTVLARALQAGHEPRSVLVSDRWLPGIASLLNDRDVPVYVGDEAELERITGFHLHRGALAAMHRPELPEVAAVVKNAKTVVILDGLVDHTNVGAAFRCAAGLGADAVLVTPECADPLYRRSVRVSMGTVLQVPWTRLPPWQEAGQLLRDHGFTVAALALADDAMHLREFAANRPERVAIVLGTEGHGLGRAALREADTVVTLPMHHGVDSLNVAAMCGVALWALDNG